LVLGEQLTAAHVASGREADSLAMTGGMPMQLVGLAALLICGGLLTRWAGRSQEKW
jgi:hypothetical protein